MKTKIKVLFSFLLLVGLLFGLYFFTDWFSKVTGYFGGEDERSQLALCLAEGGAEFYGGIYCADCEKQLEVFGGELGNIVYVECGTAPDGEIIDSKCKNLREIPAWYIKGQIYYGFKSFEELKELGGC